MPLLPNNIDAKAARRQATAWLVSEVGNMLVGGPPQLFISRQRTVWRVPIVLTSSIAGPVGEVGVVEIDAESGELILTDQPKEAFIEDLLAAISPTYLASIREAREDYRTGQVYSHADVFGQ